ncbi:MAG: hypothetical protein ACFFB0_15255 [Promethearchaeota archaeon]
MSDNDLNKMSTENKNSKNGKIFITKEALRNMISHVLRFAHKTMENSKEVMGICIGNYDQDNDKINIENAVPVTHGGTVEVGFDKEDYELLSNLGKQYSGQIVGYYHSHPSWGLYLSDSDKRNLQYFQNEKTPYGFAIVFDHTLMSKDEDFGFVIYRLDDYKNPDQYHEVSYEVETPATLDYFKWVQKFMEDFHKSNPIIIKEIKEMKEINTEDLQEIPIAERDLISRDELEKYTEVSAAISGFQNGLGKFSEILMNSLKSQIGKWISDLDTGSSNGTNLLVDSVNKLKKSISSGFLRADEWFNRNMDGIIGDFKGGVSKYVENPIESQNQLIIDNIQAKDNLSSELSKYVDQNIEYLKNELDNLNKTISDKISENLQLNSDMEELINKLESSISSSDTDLKSIIQNLDKGLKKSISPLENNFQEKIEKISSELQPLREAYTEINTLLEKLQKVITDFRNIT